MKYLSDGISLQNKRQTNMDSLLLKQGSIGKTDVILAVVCDGVGSLENGGYASQLATRHLSSWFDALTTVEHIGLKMRDALIEINERVKYAAEDGNIDTASTFTALLIAETNYYIAHTGDSRVYCMEDGELTILTSDDTTSSGALTVYLGTTKDFVPQYYEGQADTKTFMVCSDGIYKRMDTDFLTEKLTAWSRKPSKKIIKQLSQFVIDRGEQDNITLILLKIKN